jgi:hypothetical protein
MTDLDYQKMFIEMCEQNRKLQAQHAESMQVITALLQKQDSSSNAVSSSRLMSDISRRIPLFSFDPDSEDAFSTWYERHKNTFLVDGKSLSETDKVRLLLERLDESSFTKYKKHTLPEDVFDVKFDDTITSLKELFDKSASLFTQRYQLLRFDKANSQDLLEYMGEINELCEKTKLADLTADQWKCFMFVYGLKSSCYSDLRTRLIMILDKKHRSKESYTLKEIYEEAERYLSTIHDAKLVGSDHVRKSNEAVFQVNCRECWNCGDNHMRSMCPKPLSRCFKCKKKGHKADFCDLASRWMTKRNSSSESESDDERKKQTVKRDKRQSKKLNSVRVSNCATGQKKTSETDTTYSKRELEINGCPVEMKVDEKCDVSMISESTWMDLGSPALQESARYGSITAIGQHVDLIGYFPCEFTFKDQLTVGVVYVNDQFNILGWYENENLSVSQKKGEECMVSQKSKPSSSSWQVASKNKKKSQNQPSFVQLH